ncbi:phage virion morphogenesis protein [uncultured Vibrio sp.]|uniref:phage virion morphogenesis protein n=1 Tax=uncultured Vibrio sp. TaxID=114054 RepID=UPI0025CEEBE2|nr:phage virion morphogenesis protein [uncultured Vibrio sp.]
MSELTLQTPEQLTQVVESLVLTAKERFGLNERMANHARQFFRGQIRAQRDIDNNPYQSRTSRKVSLVSRGVRGKHGAKHQRNLLALNTINNKNMLFGFIRGIRTQITNESFAVGLTGVAARIGREHNDGTHVTFSTRVNGYYNPKTQKWEGGVRVKRSYQMPHRAFIGWTPALERELMAMAAEHFALEDAA